MLLIANTSWQAYAARDLKLNDKIFGQDLSCQKGFAWHHQNFQYDCSMMPRACLCQPEALNLDLPEVQVKHWHNDLFLKQTEDMNFSTLAGACKSTEMSSTHIIAIAA